MLLTRLPLIYVMVFAIPIKLALADIYTPNADGKFSVRCQCIVDGSSGLCIFKGFDDAAGKPRHDWFMEQFGRTGQPIDLNASCYRKRGVDGMGDGLCCTIPSDEKNTIEKLFKGVPQ